MSMENIIKVNNSMKEFYTQPEPLTDRQVQSLLNVEMLNAESKHPVFPEDRSKQLVIIMEELGEAAQASIDKGIGDYRQELLQTMVTCYRALLTANELKIQGRPVPPDEQG